MPAKEGDILKVHYRGTLDDGTEFDSSLDREPLEFAIGKRTLIPGFEKAVIGLEAGDKTTVRIPPEEAYGEKDNELLFQVSAEDVPEGVEPEVGMVVQLQLSNGQVADAIVSEIAGDEIILDANPPLAGEALTFEIEIVSIVH